ncbi:AsmA family protein [Sulfitobacter sp. JB4-11]|uniref:AsmA family protein n=1 Tax=Sulfitobacter rhodophyticola TaxID=3238304 RepID=UPI0035126B5F
MKWIVRIIGVLVLLVVVTVVGILMLPAEKIAQIATDQLRKITGREVTISGDVGMTFWPVLGVSAEGLEVGNADWASEGAMLSTKSAAIGVDASALLRGEIRITNIEAQSPTIRLESRKDGRNSWSFSDAAGTATIETETAPERAAQPISLQKLTITDATLIYDAEGADRVFYEGVDLSLDWPEINGAADIAATLRPSGQPVTLDARIETFATFLTGEISPLRAQISAPGGSLLLAGRGTLQGAIAADMTLKTDNTSIFLAALGAGPVNLPRGLGRTTNVSAKITLTPDRKLTLRDLVADLGRNTLRGGVDAALNGTPEITAQLSAGALDLRGLTGSDDAPAGSGGSDPAPAAGSGWPTDRIDASGLAAFNGSIGLSADSIDLGALTLGKSRFNLTNDRSRMVFALREVAAYGGGLSGEFVMNNRNGLSVGGTLNAADVQINPLLSDLADLTRFTGTGNARLSFLGVGDNVDQIMRSLKGDGTIALGRGSIEGIDLDQLLGSFDVKGGTTVFDSVNASYTIAGGILRNDDLLMLLPNFNTTGSGQINLGAQTLDYTVVPKALRVNGDRGLAVPVRISGPWSDPSVKPDLSAAIDLNFAAEKEAAETRAKAKLEEKLQEELGIQRQEGQSVEDAVKDRVEDKLKRELFKIFD